MEEKLIAQCTCKDCRKGDWDGVNAVYCMESASYRDKDDFCSRWEKYVDRTYKEIYMDCNTLKELEEKVNKDIRVVKMFGLAKERIDNIRKASEEVANLKFKE